MQENKMGTEPIPKLILKMSFPMMVSMLIQALYNVVDSVFVAQVSENCLTAVSLAYPFQMLVIALGVGTSVGVNSLMSRSLGEKNTELVNRTAADSLFLALCTSVFFVIFGLFLVEPCMNLFLPSESIQGTPEYAAQLESVALAKEYLRICTLFSFGVIFQCMFERILMSTGDTVHPMLIQIFGAVVNLIGDPILIFGWLGLPAMGVRGAAIATVAGQIIAMVTGLLFVLFRNPLVKIDLRGFRPSGIIIKKIYQVGLSSILMQALSSVTTLCLNSVLIAFTPTAVSVLGIYFKIQSFIFMPVFGMNSGVLPIIGYNYGARLPRRVTLAYRTSILYAICIMVAGMLLFWLAPEFLFSLFRASDNMLALGVPAFRIISVHFPIAAVCIMSSTLFQGTGKGLYSLISSLLRQMFVIVPVAYLFAHWFGLEAVWYCYPIAEVVSVTVSLIFVKRVFKKNIRPLYEGSADAMPESMPAV